MLLFHNIPTCVHINFILVGLYVADQFQSAGLSVFTNNWFSVHNFTPEVEDSWSLIRKVINNNVSFLLCH